MIVYLLALGIVSGSGAALDDPPPKVSPDAVDVQKQQGAKPKKQKKATRSCRG